MDPNMALQFLVGIISQHARITEVERNQVAEAIPVINAGLSGVALPPPAAPPEDGLRLVEEPAPSRQVRRATARKTTPKKK